MQCIKRVTSLTTSWAPSRGCGASSIYSLLAARVLPSIRMVGTEIDERSMEFAKMNIELNKLENQILLFKSDVNGPILPLEIFTIFSNDSVIDFTMCNPPFYASEEEIAAGLSLKQDDPLTVRIFFSPFSKRKLC